MSFKVISNLLLFLVFIIINKISFSANYYVNDNNTTGDVFCSAVGNDANNGTDPSTPKATIADIFADYDIAAGDIIYIDKGTFSWTNVLPYAGNDDGFIIQGAGNANTIFDGANSGTRFMNMGGADHGSMTFNDVQFYRYTHSGSNGGVFYIGDGYGDLTLNDCIINDCNVTGLGSSGGFLYSYMNNTITTTDCTFSNCDTPNGGTSNGGVFYFANAGGDLIATNCTFTSNTAGNGGVIEFSNSGAGTLTLTSCTFSLNSNTYATYGSGGVINVEGTHTGAITIDKCIFNGNSAIQHGGALYIDIDASVVNITNSLFYENSAGDDGGAILFYSGTTVTYNLVNCTFADNSATDDGGAVMLASTSNLTVAAKNCIFYNNIASGNTADDLEANGELINLTNCLYTAAEDIDLGGGSNTSAQTGDPSFTNAAGDDYTITSSSSCVNNGTSTGAPADDLAGNPRDATPDIGAYELAMNIWDGSSSTDWKTAANWSDNVVPTTESVLIPTSGSYTNPPIIDEADAVCGSITLQGNAVLTLSSGKLTATGSVSMASTTEIQFDGGELECSGKFSADGILDINSGTLDVDGEFEIGSTLTEEISGGTIEVAGNFDGASEGDGDFTPSGGTVELNGATATTVDNHATASFYNLTVNKSANGSTLNTNIAVTNNLTVSAGTLAHATYTNTVTGATDINTTVTLSTGTLDANGSFDATGGTITFSGAGNLNLGSTVTSLGTFTESTSTVLYDAAGAQNVISDNYYNLTIGGSGTKTSQGTINISNNFTLNAGTYDVAATTNTVTGISDINATLSVSTGTFNADGIFDATGGTIDFTGTGNLILSSTVTSLGTLDAAIGTVTYDGGTQAVLADSYYNLTISTAGTKTAGGSMDVNGNLSTAATATCKLDMTSHDLNVAGNLNVGAIDGLDLSDASALFTLDGTTDQTVSHAGNSAVQTGYQLINHDFESSNNGWTAGGSVGGMVFNRISSPSPFSAEGNATTIWCTNPFNDYGASDGAHVTSSAIDMTAMTAMTFSIDVRYNTESGFDGMNIYYSTDGGSNWTLFGANGSGTNWYNNTGVDGINDMYAEVVSDPHGWSGDNTAWQTATYSLPGAVEGQADVRFRIYFGSDSGVNDDGVGFDNVIITGTYSGGTGSQTKDFTINKSGGDVILSSEFSVDGTLTFTSGDIDATSNNLVFTAYGTASGANDASHVKGTIVKTTESITAFTFPIGDGTDYRPIGITPDGASSTDWTVSYTASSHPDTDVDGSGLDHISTQEYWNLDRSGSANASISLTWTADNGVTDYTELAIAHYDGTTDWDMIASTPSGNNTAGTINSNATVTTFSPFTIGSTGSANPLPVNLVAFYGENKNQVNQLRWITESEKNSDYFTVEKTTDGILFEPVGTRQGAGNSIYHTSYLLVDDNVEPVINYYRLKQTDFDGNSKYSNLISIDNRLENQKDKTLMRITNTWGQEVKSDFRGIVIYIYSDGSIERVFQN